jgi:hypothetical protein
LMKKRKLSRFERFIFALVFIGFALLLLFIAYLLWFMANDKSVANYLPEDRTIAFAEFEDLSLPVQMQSDETFSLDKIEGLLKKIYDIDYKNAVSSWADGRFGIALIKNLDENSTPVIFMITHSRRKTLAFFENLALPDEKLEKSGSLRLPIYSYPQSQPFSFAFIGPYVFISSSVTPLAVIQEVYEGSAPAITSQKDYQKTLSNMPRNSWMRGYVNYQALNFKGNVAVSNIVEPLKYVINHFALAIRKNPDGFHFNTFLNLTPDLLALREEHRDKTPFAYKLTDYISSKNIMLYIGGANLSLEWENTLDTISNLNPAYGIILEGAVRAQVSKVFGSEVDLRNDIYPLFSDEYAFAVAGQEDGKRINISLLLSHDNKEFVEAKLEKMMKGFRYLAAQFAPKVRVVVLPDGTESRELVADISRLEENSENYQGTQVTCLEVKDTSSGFCYAVTDELLIITNNRDTAKGIIDLTISPKYMLSQHQPFRQTIGNLSKVSDEITFIDLQEALPAFNANPYYQLAEKYLKPLSAVSWVKHYFDDGVSTEGYILVK